ncbi:response regulator transcription factor [Glaciimonas sp. PCH181]|uniref:response regulator transcription factor n=1 Tax=Glaciimonas sp. PCH181 TaxID=2133943 RepID=UPI000D3D59B5|nr:response regulator transcription factor [Glaciimonas sp. PCH181]PUA19275.1 response regulator [Glaciimonas sp. PCH181]
MQIKSRSIAVRFLGFSPREIHIFDATFAVELTRSVRYFRLSENSLQQWDICIVNAEDLQALASLDKLQPDDAFPVLLVGTPRVALPYLAVQKPIRWLKLFDALDTLIAHRNQLPLTKNARIPAISTLSPERRRRERLDLDLTDPGVYEKMRVKPALTDRILVVDHNPAFRDDLALSMLDYLVPVEWVGDATSAAEVYMQLPISIVLINPQLPDLDPYFFCEKIKDRYREIRISVFFLVDEPFTYQPALAQLAGCDGFLARNLGQPQIVAALSKFLSRPR